jgi:hypothetical protein
VEFEVIGRLLRCEQAISDDAFIFKEDAIECEMLPHF